jgi:endo-beta-N-acetylglucosaminidase D
MFIVTEINDEIIIRTEKQDTKENAVKRMCALFERYATKHTEVSYLLKHAQKPLKWFSENEDDATVFDSCLIYVSRENKSYIEHREGDKNYFVAVTEVQ